MEIMKKVLSGAYVEDSAEIDGEKLKPYALERKKGISVIY